MDSHSMMTWSREVQGMLVDNCGLGSCALAASCTCLSISTCSNRELTHCHTTRDREGRMD